jgi:4-hydroxybenzoate polyprenyltransferase
MFESKTPFESKTFKRTYLIGTVIVWVSILIGTAIILSGTPYFAQILPILSVGVFWFIVLLPGAYFWTRPESDQTSSSKPAEHTP